MMKSKRVIPTNLDFKKREIGKKVVIRKIARQIDRIERWTDRGGHNGINRPKSDIKG